jgi:hypothetical protein
LDIEHPSISPRPSVHMSAHPALSDFGQKVRILRLELVRARQEGHRIDNGWILLGPQQWLVGILKMECHG